MTFSTVISNANLLKKRRNKKRKENKFSSLTVHYGKHFFLDHPWRVTTDIVKIYCGPSRRWRHVSVALSADLQTSELLASPSPPTHGQGPLPILAPTDWAGQGLQDYDLGSHRKKSSVSPLHVPSHCHRARERERQGNLLLTSLGPSPLTKKKLNGTYGASSHSFPPSAWRWLQDWGQEAQVRCRTSDQVLRTLLSEEQHSQALPQKYPKIFNAPIIWFQISWSSLSWKQFFLKTFLFQFSTPSLFKDNSYF